jgi:hypothetical protein
MVSIAELEKYEAMFKNNRYDILHTFVDLDDATLITLGSKDSQVSSELCVVVVVSSSSK